MLDEQRLFSETLALVGQEVEVGTRTDNQRRAGRLVNVMFDSLLLSTEAGSKVVRFVDLVYLSPRK
jgi:hypothetical protein